MDPTAQTDLRTGARAQPAIPAPFVVPPRTRRRAWPLVVLALVIAAAGGAAWWAVGAPIEVAVIHPTRGAALEAVYATGLVEAINTARVGTTIAGRILTLAVDEGARITRDQELAHLDDSQARQRLSEAQARLALAEQELARDRELASRRIASVQQLQRSQGTRDSAAALVALAARQRDEFHIRSPLDGVVIKRVVEPGETVAANALLFDVAALSPLRVAANVDERDIPQIRMGAPVGIRAEAFAGEAFPAKVTAIRPEGETTTRTFRVEANLPADTRLMIGMTVDVNIVVAERAGALLVPAAAVRHEPSRGGRAGPAYVYRIIDDRAVRTPVQTGAVGAEAVEIRAGLDPDSTLIAAPPDRLADGARVRVHP